MARKRLYFGQPAAAGTSSTIVATSNTFQVHAATVCNPTGASKTLSVYVMDSAGTASDANQVYDAISVGANDQAGLGLLINHVLLAGEVVHLVSETDDTLTVCISGDQSQ